MYNSFPSTLSVCIDKIFTVPCLWWNQNVRDAEEHTIISQSLVVDEYKRLGSEFYQCDALDLAPRLLGKLLRRDEVVLQITEVGSSSPLV